MNINFFDNHNLCVIPVYPQSKRPKLSEWQKRCAADNNPVEFSLDDNVGVVLGDASEGLVDVDLDSDLARKIAPYFLPSTGWVFGRKSASRSHYLYRISGDPGPGRKFDIGSKFAEYRANGQMTVFPPSIHESGELIKFSEFGNAGETSRAELLNALSSMAICAIIAPEYIEGKRHDIVLSLAGTLLKNCKSEDEVLRLVEGLCSVTGDEEKGARLDDVHRTAERHNRGEPITQYGRLRELIDESTLNHLRKYLASKPHQGFGAELKGTAELLSSDEQNDTGVAQLFGKKANGHILFDENAACFYFYDKGLWVPDAYTLKVASEFDAFIQNEVARLRANVERISDLECLQQIKFLLKYRNRSNARNAMEQFRSVVRTPNINTNFCPDHIAVSNGIVDLRSGVLMPCLPEHYVTKRLELDYDAAADCPVFRKVLADAFGEDEELIDYFQGIMGYWLTGLMNRQEFYILYGQGANGKSTIIDAINYVLGPYTGTLMSQTIFEAPNNHYLSDLASVRGCRLAVVHEAQSDARLNSALLKQITGGDWLKAKALYKDPTPFKPQFKMVIICNRQPNLDAYDDAFRRRIKMIPFEQIVPPHKRDSKLGEKLRGEAQGILNFMISGAQRYFRNEIREPHAVKEATRRYFRDHDSIDGFLKHSTVTRPDNSVGKGDLYHAYKEYCAEETLDAVPKHEFGRILKKLGYRDTRSGRERKWQGLGLRSEGTEDIFSEADLADIFQFAT